MAILSRAIGLGNTRLQQFFLERSNDRIATPYPHQPQPVGATPKVREPPQTDAKLASAATHFSLPHGKSLDSTHLGENAPKPPATSFAPVAESAF